MNIIIKQIFPSSCHFLRVRSKYLPQHPILEYLQPLFVRQPGRPSFTPICNTRRNYTSSSLIKRSSNKMFKVVICWQKTKSDVQKSTSSNCNSTFSVLSVFNTQTVHHIPKPPPSNFLHLRQMHYVFHERIISANLQNFTSITCKNTSSIVNY